MQAQALGQQQGLDFQLPSLLHNLCWIILILNFELQPHLILLSPPPQPSAIIISKICVGPRQMLISFDSCPNSIVVWSQAYQ